MLLGDASWTPRPVVLDEFRVLDDGSLIGNLEEIDERWGASLEIRTADPAAMRGRHPAPAGGRWNAHDFAEVPRLLLYDLAADPRALRDVSSEHPERAAAARERLLRLFEEHRALAALFEAGEEAELSAEQQEALRALGYSE